MNWDRGTHRKVMLVGTLFCAAFVAISFYLKPQPDAYVAKKADRLIQTVGGPPTTN